MQREIKSCNKHKFIYIVLESSYDNTMTVVAEIFEYEKDAIAYMKEEKERFPHFKLNIVKRRLNKRHNIEDFK